MKVIIKMMVAITMALTLIITAKHHQYSASEPAARKMRVSRFLQQKDRNPRAADHCNKDNEICSHTLEGGRNASCCNNKCMDLWYDDKNCGACKNKCAFTETCCRGNCVNLAYDKRHCGFCGNKCMPAGYCIYGLCDYA